MDSPELGDDGVIHALAQIDPRVIQLLHRRFLTDPDPGRNQARDIPSSQ